MAASNVLSLVQETLADTLADCATFWTLCGAADRTEALTHIYQERLPRPENGQSYTQPELEDLFPYAIISMDTAEGFSADKDSSSSFRGAGTLWLMIGRQLPEGDDAVIDREFKNYVGGIVEELIELAIAGQNEAGTVSYLQFDTIQILVGPYRDDEDDVPGEAVEQAVIFGVRFSGVVMRIA